MTFTDNYEEYLSAMGTSQSLMWMAKAFDERFTTSEAAGADGVLTWRWKLTWKWCKLYFDLQFILKESELEGFATTLIITATYLSHSHNLILKYLTLFSRDLGEEVEVQAGRGVRHDVRQRLGQQRPGTQFNEHFVFWVQN